MEMVDTPVTATPALRTIGSSLSKNTSNISSRKEWEKYGDNEPVHDEGDNFIASHKKSMFLVQSCLVQE